MFSPRASQQNGLGGADGPSTGRQTSDSTSSSRLPSASLGKIPSISLPKGGGSIGGMGEKFDVNSADGTGSVNIPISTSPSRGLNPELSLNYNSGNGNSPFGMGWDISVSNISRKTALGLPQYQDGYDSDVFLISSAEDLVPLFQRNDQGQVVIDQVTNCPVIQEETRENHVIRRYSPRIEGSFLRIERWTSIFSSKQIHWRVITPNNITSIYGKDANSRIYDPCTESEEQHIFSWLLAEQYDSFGNAILYKYKKEDSTGVAVDQVNERNRTHQSRSSNRYLSVIKYGNKLPNRDLGSWAAFSACDIPDDHWMFTVAFDYGEFDEVSPTLDVLGPWNCRKDPFSTYRSTFEIRTYRLCRRILMFHHFPAELFAKDYLVSSTNLVHDENDNFAYLKNISRVGYLGQNSKTLPPVEFTYSHFPTSEELSAIHVEDVDLENLENLPSGIDSSTYQWVDLDGEGLPGVLAEQSGAWFYKRNLSANNQPSDNGEPHVIPKFGPMKVVLPKPPITQLDSRHHFADVTGDGLMDVLCMDNQVWGYSTRHFDPNLGWVPFREFKSIPNVQLDENVRFMDITGDGLADILMTEDHAFICYHSLGEEGYGTPSRTLQSLDEEKGPQIIFGDTSQTIYLADMSGDGLSDIVRIRNGEICYWPNTGYGKFGAKVTMRNAPWFAKSDQFNHQYIFLSDVDGSGITDIIYLGSHGVDIYFNQAGNSFREREHIPNFPPIDSVSSINTIDLLGNGTTCLVWSSALPANAKSSLKYLNLNRGVKPHLLIGITNNLGAETRIHYAPSTKFYLDDKAAGNQWITRLPFPVQCVERSETVDYVSHNRFASRYAYHHGFFDGFEREFRGFAMVEQWDTEDFDVMKISGGQNIDSKWYAPPVHTKSWFHLGGFLSENVSQLATEYYDADQYREGGLATLLEDSIVPRGLGYSETRESYRALKGHILREELYVDDDGPKSRIPYTVTESNYEVRLIQPEDNHHHSIFMVVPRENVSFNLERNPKDARVQHNLALEVDEYGNSRKSLSIAYGREKSPLQDEDRIIQEKLLMTYSENDYTNGIDTPTDYLVPFLFESRSYQIHGFEHNQSSRFTMSQFTSKNGPASLAEISHEAKLTGGKQKRLIQQSRTLFRRNNLDGLLPAGKVESMAILGQTYNLAFTPGQLSSYQQSLPDGSTKKLLPNINEVFEKLGRYVDLDDDGKWWSPSGNSFFSTETTKPAEELAEARKHFFTVRRGVDQFGNQTIVEYDNYNLLHTRTIDAVGNTSCCQNDYRILNPYLVTDPNGNRTACAFDELGSLVATAIMGKEGESLGDSLEGFHLTTQDEMDQFFGDPTGPIARLILGKASSCTLYDVCRFWMEPDVTKKKPNFQATIVRETHASDTTDVDKLKIQINFIYIDGFGRTVQSKIQAEPQNGVTTWVGDGWTVFNNKGSPVKKYEPFFDTSHDFVFDNRVGVSPTFIYDPLGRMISLIHPNHTWTKFVFNNWETKEYDANDTVLLDPKSDPDIGSFISRVPYDDIYPTWYEARKTGQLGRAEQIAADKAARHANTPTISHFDPLGRAFFSITNNGEFGMYQTRSDLDIQGNLLHIIDPKGRRVLDTTFNILGQSIHIASPEAGERFVFSDVLGQQVYSWDSRMNRLRTEYDALGRLTASFLQIDYQHEVMVDQILYGESIANPEIHNARGHVVKLYDQAGVVSQDEYDFKGNLLSSKRKLAKEYKKILDWRNAVPLEDESFITKTTYDALNRSVQTTLPDKTVFRWKYNEANLLQQTIGNIRGAETTKTFIENIEYNAKGQRIRIRYGNNVVTSYIHDKLTTLLTKLTTHRDCKRFISDDSNNSSTSWLGSNLQNLHYTYDASGNITKICDDIQQPIFFQNERVEPSNEYTYDAVYRLIEATGREHLGLAKKPNGSSGSLSESKEHLNDGKEMRAYVERFKYDEVGNFLSVKHHGTGSLHEGWTRNYVYEEPSLLEPTRSSNRLSQTSIGSVIQNYSYDGLEGSCGNMTSMPGLTMMKWDFRNQMQATSRQIANDGTPETTYYVYNSAGERVRKVTERYAAEGQKPTRLKERIYAGVEIYREYNGRSELTLERETLHVMDAQSRIALIETRTHGEEKHVPRQLIRYQIGNHIGSVCLELDAQGDLISYEEYTPYGSTSYQAAHRYLHSPQRYKYTGKERDDESGLDYFGARYYSSDIGRWINCDPSGMQDGVNVYIYVHGNPVNWVDPDGRVTKKHKNLDGTEIELDDNEDMRKAYNLFTKYNSSKLAIGRFRLHLKVWHHLTNITTAWSHRIPIVHDPLLAVMGIDSGAVDNGKEMPNILHNALTYANYDLDINWKIGNTDWGQIVRDGGIKAAQIKMKGIRDTVENNWGLSQGHIPHWIPDSAYETSEMDYRLKNYRFQNNKNLITAEKHAEAIRNALVERAEPVPKRGAIILSNVLPNGMIIDLSWYILSSTPNSTTWKTTPRKRSLRMFERMESAAHLAVDRARTISRQAAAREQKLEEAREDAQKAAMSKIKWLSSASKALRQKMAERKNKK